MCTAISLQYGDHYFGRNLDLEYSYRESVTITPRNYPLHFRHMLPQPTHHALIGMAYIQDDYPLYYEATNEKGLSMAGLNFPGNAVYHPFREDAYNITPFELIPWLLGQCSTVGEVAKLLADTNVLNESFSAALPLSPLHWIVADRTKSITVESTADGLHVYPNPVGVMTNNPPFPKQMFNLNQYMNLTRTDPKGHFAGIPDMTVYSHGLGALGLPGDWSSPSRFVKAVFMKSCTESDTHRPDRPDAVSQFFHLLDGVAYPWGSVAAGDRFSITVYSCCCDTDKGIYYYKAYENSQICAVDMHRTDLAGSQLISYPLVNDQQLHWQN